MDITNIVQSMLSEGDLSSGIASIGGAVAPTTETPVTTEAPADNIVNEDDDIRLSGKAMKTLGLMHIAEQLVNEEVEENEELSEYGLISEGKLTLKGREWVKKYLPTLYAS